MRFNKSSVQLSAAVILALTTKDYITAGVFFTLGIFERLKEHEEEERRRRVESDICEDNLNILRHIKQLSTRIYRLKDFVDPGFMYVPLEENAIPQPLKNLKEEED